MEFGSGGGGYAFYVNTSILWSRMMGLFSDDEIDSIRSLCESLELSSGTIGNNNEETIYRKSAVRFIYPNAETMYMFDRLRDGILEVNKLDYNFELTGLYEGLQFTQYGPENDHYNWHLDIGVGAPVRKLSFSVQLTDPSDYDGGDLELQYGPEVTQAPRDKGTVIFFPSYILHRVTPVTRGTRHSLVGWVSGPAFR